MNSYKIILASCHIIKSPQAIPLATSILKSYQPFKKEIDIKLENFYLDIPPVEAASIILRGKPDSVGFSIYIWNRDYFMQIAEIIKKTNKDIIIFAGGAEITASYQFFLNNNDYDFLIRGEGEIPFVELLNYLIGKSPVKPDKLIRQSHVKDLNLIPSPFIDSSIDLSEWDGILWELSRGCPFNCSFCLESRGIEGVRYFSENRIRDELILFEKNKVDQIFVLDPTFNINRDRSINIISMIKEYAPNIHFIFEIRAELLDEELAAEFAELHCSLQIGLQSSSKKVLKCVNRNINQEIFSDKIGYLNKYGAIFGLDLIFGLPKDTKKGFLNSLDYALYQIPNHLDIFRLSIFPGTELYEKADIYNLNYNNDAPYSVISTPDYSEEELNESEEIAKVVEIFYNKGKAAPWFLSITELLKLSPSTFFIELNKYIAKSNPDFNNTFILQNKFLKHILIKHNKENFLPVVLDLCKYHFLYSEALYADSDFTEIKIDKKLKNSKKYKRSSILKIGKFNFDATLYAELGMIDIEEFAHNYLEDDSYALIFNNGYEILTMSVEKRLFNIVEKITAEKSLSEILDLEKIKADEVDDFISFLIESSLIIPGN